MLGNLAEKEYDTKVSRIQDFLTRKSTQLFRLTGLAYVERIDFDEIAGFSKIEIDYLYTALQDIKFRMDRGAYRDMDTCPWCIVKYFCCKCTYGDRYGKCYKKGSRYATMVKILGDKEGLYPLTCDLNIIEILEKSGIKQEEE